MLTLLPECLGIDAPYDFALACRHGNDWREALEISIENAMQLYPTENDQDKQVSDALLFSFQKSKIAAFKILLKIKVNLIAGCSATRKRCSSLRPLTWKVKSNCHMEM